MKKIAQLLTIIVTVTALSALQASIGQGLSDIAHGAGDVARGTVNAAEDVAVGTVHATEDVVAPRTTEPELLEEEDTLEYDFPESHEDHLTNTQFEDKAEDNDYGGDYPAAGYPQTEE